MIIVLLAYYEALGIGVFPFRSRASLARNSCYLANGPRPASVNPFLAAMITDARPKLRDTINEPPSGEREAAASL